MEITRQEVKEIMAAAKLALEPVLKKYNLDFGRSGARFGSGQISVKFEFLKAGAKELITNARAASYQIPYKAGDVVWCGGSQFTVDSITPRGSVIIKAESGKLFRAKPQSLSPVGAKRSTAQIPGDRLEADFRNLESQLGGY